MSDMHHPASLRVFCLLLSESVLQLLDFFLVTTLYYYYLL